MLRNSVKWVMDEAELDPVGPNHLTVVFSIMGYNLVET